MKLNDARPPNKIPVMLYYPQYLTARSGWRDGMKYYIFTRGYTAEVSQPAAWSAITFGQGEYAERISLIQEDF